MADVLVAPPRSRVRAVPGTGIGIAGVSVAVLCMLWLHVASSGVIDPLTATLSNYVYADGVGWMFGVSVLGIGAGGLAALHGLNAIGSAGRGVRIGLGLVAAGCLLVAAFPTDKGDAVSLSAHIHRYAAGLLLISLPAAAFAVARSAGGARLAARAWISRTVYANAAIGLITIASYLDAVPAFYYEIDGLVQRVLVIFQITVLAQLIYLPVRARSAP